MLTKDEVERYFDRAQSGEIIQTVFSVYSWLPEDIEHFVATAIKYKQSITIDRGNDMSFLQQQYSGLKDQYELKQALLELKSRQITNEISCYSRQITDRDE